MAHGPDAYMRRKQYPAQKVETAVWELVFGLLKDPARLRAGLAKVIERERRAVRDDPEREARAWRDKLTEADRKRSRYKYTMAKGRLCLARCHYRS